MKPVAAKIWGLVLPVLLALSLPLDTWAATENGSRSLSMTGKETPGLNRAYKTVSTPWPASWAGSTGKSATGKKALRAVSSLTQDCASASYTCGTISVLEVSTQGSYKTYRVKIQTAATGGQNCNNDISFAAFGLPAGVAAGVPANGSVYQGSAGAYQVVNPTGTNGLPGYNSIKFENLGHTFKNGVSEIFEFTVDAGVVINTMQVTAKHGPTQHTVTLDLSGCSESNECDQANPVSSIGGFLVLVQGDATLATNESDGPVAIGGNLKLTSSYQVANNNSGGFYDGSDAKPTGLLVNGRVIFQSGSGITVNGNSYVKIGDCTGANIYPNGGNTRITPSNFDANPKVNVNTGQPQNTVCRPNLFDFGTAFYDLGVIANGIAACESNVILRDGNNNPLPNQNNPPQTVKINIAANQTNVLNISGSALSQIQNFTFNNKPTATAPLVINVNAPGAFSWNVFNMAGIGDQEGAFIIWTFNQTTTLTLNGGGTMKGALFTPNTDVIKNSSGNIDGNVVAKTFVQNGGEIHHYPFAASISICDCEEGCETLVLNCPEDISVACDGSVDPSATGTASGGPFVEYEDQAFLNGCGGSGYILRTWRAFNSCEEETTCIQTITVVDNQGPVFGGAEACWPQGLAFTRFNSSQEAENQFQSLLFSSEGRIGNNAVGGVYELAIHNVSPFNALTTGEFVWPKGVDVPFSLEYNPNASGTNRFKFTITSGATQRILTIDPASFYNWPLDMDGILLSTRTAANTTVRLSNLTLDGQSLNALFGHIMPGTEQLDNAVITGANLADGFVLTGNVKMDWSGTPPSGFNMNFNLKLGKLACDPSTGCPQDLVVNCSDPNADMIIENWLNSVVVTDACGGDVTLTHNYTGYTGCEEIVVDFAAADACGNFSDCSATLTIVNESEPVVIVPAALGLACGDNQIQAQVAAWIAGASVNGSCGGHTITLSPTQQEILTQINHHRQYGSNCSLEIEVVFSVVTACGQTAQQTGYILVSDVNPPVINCPSDLILECGAANKDALIAAWLASASATDDCRTPQISNTYNPAAFTGACGATGTQTVTFTATDACGNQHVCTATITIEDTTAPVFSATLQDQTLSCTDEVPAAETLTATDACGSATVEMNVQTIQGDCDASYTLVRTYTATDACGNTAVQVQNIYVGDHVAPQFAYVPSGYEAACGETLVFEMAEAMDNCGEPTVTVTTDSIPGDCAGSYTFLRTFTATDACGNTATATQQIVVGDNEAPQFTFVPGNTTISCEQSPSETTATATDNCGGVVITTNEQTIPGACDGSYTIVRTFVATDACGNTATAVQQIAVIDDVAPVWISDLPQDITLVCEEAPLPEVLSAMDNCNVANVTLEEHEEEGECQYEHFLVRTWTAADGCGNQVQHTQRILIACGDKCDAYDKDDQKFIPPLEGGSRSSCGTSGSISVQSCAGGTMSVSRSLLQQDRYIILHGNCGVSSSLLPGCFAYVNESCQVVDQEYTFCFDYTLSSGIGGSYNPGTVKFVPQMGIQGIPSLNPLKAARLSWVFDNLANYGLDMNNPSHRRVMQLVVWKITNPTNASVQGFNCNSSSLPNICSGGQNVSNWCAIYDAAVAAIPTAPIAPDLEMNPSNNSAFVNQSIQITLQSTENQLTLNLSDGSAMPVLCNGSQGHGHVLVDNGNGTGTLTLSGSGLRTVYLCFTRATTASFNFTAQATAVVSDGSGFTIYMPQAPHNGAVQPFFSPGNSILNPHATVSLQFRGQITINCPQDLNIECSSNNQTQINTWLNTVTAQADCGIASLTNNYNPNNFVPGTCPVVSRQVVTFTVTDNCGQTRACTATIKISDTQKPTWTSTLPSDITVECDAIPAPATLTATDNCGDPSIQYNQVRVDGTCANKYTLKRTWTVTDACGNSRSHLQVITVKDHTAPVFTHVPANYTAQCSDNLVYANATATDNCSTPVITERRDTIAGNCTNNYVIKRTFTATDVCGNTKTAVQSITVTDTQIPTFTHVPADYTIECHETPVYANATATDNCSTPVITVRRDTIAGNCANNYVIKRTFTATDACGNTKTAIQQITVKDQTRPTFTYVPASYTATCNGSPVFEQATATDNCGTPAVTERRDTIAGVCAGNFTIVRTFTATDACGNSKTAQQTIQVGDDEAPVFTHVPADYTLECHETPVYANATATDNCGTPVITEVRDTIAGSCANNYVIKRTFTATDACGNTKTAIQRITVKDQTKPTFTHVPGDYTIECHETPVYANATATDNCGGVPVITERRDTIAGSCVNNYVIKRTFTATDACGNTKTATQQITVKDQTKPSFTHIPADYTLECHETPVYANATATDNCGGVPVITERRDTIAGSCVNNYVIKRTFTATDACGNTKTATQQITVKDQTKPSFTHVPGDYTIECHETPVYANATATDNCSVPVVTEVRDTIAGSCVNNYVIKRTFTATDACGNTKTATQQITVKDQTRPTFTYVPASYTTTCHGSPVFEQPTATDNCGTPAVTESRDTIPGVCAGNFTIVRTFTATDACGNSKTAQQTIQVGDDEAPVFTHVPADYTLECHETPVYANATATDNCGTPVITEVRDTIAGACASSYVIKRTFTATDACGNTKTAIQKITIKDETRPTFTHVPADYTIECHKTPTFASATATDNCGVPVVTEVRDTIAGACANSYVIKRTFTATDACGNKKTAVQSITVTDTQIPSFTHVPADYTLECHETPVYANATATDNCGVPVVTEVRDTIAGACANSYVIKRTFTATDACGNTKTAIQKITVKDQTRPTFTHVPADYTLECHETPVYANATATDNCGVPVVTEVRDTIAGACANSYVIKRTFTATDACGNKKTATQQITIKDETKPVFTHVPANYTVSCHETPVYANATATDNCGVPVVTEVRDTIAGACASSYVIKRTFTATDVCGNTATAQQTIQVGDDKAPVFTHVPADYTLECHETPVYANATATDNCGVPVVTEVRDTIAGACANSYVIKRTFTATDACGNTKTAIQKITVKDETRPVFTHVPADYTLECHETPVYANATATDNCGVPVVTEVRDTIAGACANSYVIKRTFTATDACGNKKTATQQITIKDETKPAFTHVPADYTIECHKTPTFASATATDNCGVPVVTEVRDTIAGACVSSYVIKRTFTATDACGNTKTAVQQITVKDETKPSFTHVPADYTIECHETPVYANATATDNCGVPVVTEVRDTIAGACANSYVIKRTFTATDACGNTKTATQKITVKDETKPVFTHVPADYVVACNDQPVYAPAIATDNCGIPTVTERRDTIPGVCPANYTIIRTFTATDVCGNTRTAQQTIQVGDDEAPVFTHVPADYTLECHETPVYANATATDNCGVPVVTEVRDTIAGACANSYVIKRTFTATDACGNTKTAIQKITVKDQTKPVFTHVPANYTAECDDQLVFATATATDNCSTPVVSEVRDTTAGHCANSYVIKRTFTATDACGNTKTAVQVITVVDTTAPVFTYVQMDKTVSCEEEVICEAAIAVDNCGQAFIETVTDTVPGHCANSYRIVRTFTATDLCGNSATAQHIITVIDTTAPVFTHVPANYTAECDDQLVFATATATDNCSIPVVSEVRDTTAGHCANSYVITRTFTATDACGNTKTAVQVITVVDTTAPAFTIVPANYTAYCMEQLFFGAAQATDNCGVPVVSESRDTTTGHCAGNYVITRTFTATDACGNMKTAVQVITVIDTVAPAFTYVPVNYTAECDDELVFDMATAADQCSGATVSESRDTTAGHCADNYVITRTFTAVDGCGNSRTAVQVITVVDTTAPVFTHVPASYTAECDDQLVFAAAKATDNCSTPVVSEVRDTTAGHCVNSYVITRTFTAVDICGNAKTAVQVITVVDTTAPVFTHVPANYTAECDDQLVYTPATATDNCSTPVVSEVRDTTAGHCANNYMITRTFTATDACGNTKTAVQVITVVDTTAPVFTYVQMDKTVSCEEEVICEAAIAIDNCGQAFIVTVTDTVPGHCANSYRIVRTFTATDLCGNSSTAQHIVTVVDTTAPVLLNLVQDLTVSCEEIIPAFTPLFADNCEGTLAYTTTADTSSLDCGFAIVRTVTATDVCGNATTAIQHVTVVDTTAPVFTHVPANYTAECDEELVYEEPAAVDNCTVATLSETRDTTAGSCAYNYVITRTFTAIDSCGNARTARQVITVRDSEGPVFTYVPEDYTLSCEQPIFCAEVEVEDNCGEVDLQDIRYTLPGDCPNSYTYVRLLIATDECGNVTDSMQVITIVDTTAPVFTYIPVNYTVDCDDHLVFEAPTAKDNCGTAVLSEVRDTTAGHCVNNYVITRTFTAVDQCGNSRTAVQVITVADQTAPVFTHVPASYTAECDDRLVFVSAKATDNCSTPVVSEVRDTTAGHCVNSYVITRTFTATDVCGNSATAVQVITVVDTTAPVFTYVQMDKTVSCEEEVICEAAIAIDNCGQAFIVTVTDTVPGHCANSYRIVRTFTATDLCGNSSTAQHVVTVVDTTAPVFTIVPANYTAYCADQLFFGTAQAIDNCGVPVVSENRDTTTGHCAGNYTITRTFTAVDACGNMKTAVQVITVVDTTAPVFTHLPANYTAECDEELVFDLAKAADQCSGATVTEVRDTTAGSCAYNYVITRTFTAVDDCGNARTAQQVITVRDSEGPVFTYVPEDYTLSCEQPIFCAEVEVEDNCGEVDLQDIRYTLPGDCPNSYTYVRLLIATDECGNVTDSMQVITIVDTTAPVFTYIPANYTVDCDDHLVFEAPTAKDNCGTAVLSEVRDTTAGHCVNNYVITRTFTAVDQCGNSRTAVQVITVADQTAPVFTHVPASYTAECDDRLVFVSAKATDNCSTPVVSEVRDTTSGHCVNSYVITRTFTATDACGNSATAVQVITVVDTTAPVFTYVQMDKTVSCEEEVICEAAIAIDNCGQAFIVTVTDTVPGHCANSYRIVRTFTATDLCGNSSTAQHVVTVVDTTAPAFTYVPANYTAECDDQLVFAAATATDNCSTPVISETRDTTAGHCVNSYVITRTFTATDACGNMKTAVQVITVVDTTAPAFTVVPANYTAYCTEQLFFGSAQATDNCGIPVVSEDRDTTAGQCAGNYVITRTFTAIDACGNSTTAVQVITVIDTVAPAFTYVPANYTAECDDELAFDMATAVDQCSGATVSEVRDTTAGHCADNYVITRTFTAVDGCGNSTTAVQVITVVDTTAPVFTHVPANYTAECDDQLVFATATATDNCSTPVVSEVRDTTAGHCVNSYAITRTFTAVDVCGNSSTAVQVITVVDTTAPVFTYVQMDKTVSCEEEVICEAAIAIDNCGQAFIVTVTDTVPGHCANSYRIVRTFTATDLCGNSSTAQHVITVVDTTAPVFTHVPANYTAECDDQLVFAAATATDNCSTPVISETRDTTAGHCVNSYVITRTFTATDACGNMKTAVQVITVVDTTAPAFTVVPANYTAYCTEQLFFGSAQATDNCGIPVVSEDRDTTTGHCAGNYVITRTFTAVDACGNSTTAVQVITVIDTVAPAFTYVPANYTAECDDELAFDMATAVDQCSGATVSEVRDTTAGHCADNYVITRTFTAVDGCGNSATAVQVITVVDTTAPVFTHVPANYTAECDDQLVFATATATDNCSTPVVSEVRDTTAGHCVNSYAITRTFTAVDVCGNSSTAVQVITVVDTTAPVFTYLPADFTVACDGEPIYEAATASDNCGTAAVTEVRDTLAGHCLNSYTVIRTFTATDLCGNTRTAQQVITVGDEIAPVFTYVPANYTSECHGELVFETATATDNCGTVEVTESRDTTAGHCVNSYVITRTFTAVDACGNTSTAQQVITVIDTTAPVFTIVPANYTAYCTDQLFFGAAQAIDNCDVPVVSESRDTVTGHCAGNFVITRTFTAVDACGNSATAVQVITVIDTVAPAFTYVPANYTAECDGELVFDMAAAADQCSGATVSESRDTVTGDCAGNFVITRTFTAVDGCGNTATATQVITVIDTTAPVFAFVPADYTLTCEEPIFCADVEVYDNCGEVDLQDIRYTLPGDCLNSFTFVRLLIATDACGNVTDTMQVITVIDTTAPTFAFVPADYSASCSDELDLRMAEATDNCGTATVTELRDTIAGDCVGSYIITRTFTATDLCGNTSTVQQTITVTDETAPIFTFVPADYTTACIEEPVYETATATDNCSQAIVSEVRDMVAGTCAGSYVITRTFTATDACGNTSTAVQVITIADEVAPEFTFVPADYTAACDDELVYEAADATDLCGTVTVTTQQDTTAGACAGSYVITRTFTATDACGNTTTAQQTITVTDETAPVFTIVPADYAADCTDDLFFGAAQAIDNCGSVTVSEVRDTVGAGSCAGSYVITRTFTATDACGNTSTAQQVITVTDETAPVFTSVPADMTVICDAEVPATQAEATDACGTVTVVSSDVQTPGSCAGSYVITRTFTATDDCGNTATAVQVISVTDGIAPSLSNCSPLDETIECQGPEGNRQAYIEWHNNNLALLQACAEDNCGAVTITSDFNPDVTFDCNGVIVVNYFISDDCGNTSTFTATFAVQDKLPPVIELLEGIVDGRITNNTVVVQCNAANEEWNLPNLTEHSVWVRDNCSDNVTVEMTKTASGSGNCAADGFFYRITYTWTANDQCGNISSRQLTVEVVDTVAPVLVNVPADLTIECTNAPAEPLLSGCEGDDCCEDAVLVTDECECAAIDFEEQILGNPCDATYYVLRTWTATDNCGNQSFETQVITIINDTKITTSFVNDRLEGLENGEELVINCDNGVYEEPTWVYLLGESDMVVNDYCRFGGELEYRFDNFLMDVSSNCKADGFKERRMLVWTVQDQCGNYDQRYIYLMFKDTVGPEIFGLDLACEEAFSEIDVFDYCTDNVSITFYDVETASLCNDQLNDVIRIWEATDECGNKSYFEQRILNELLSAEPFAVVNNQLVVAYSNAGGGQIQVGCVPDSVGTISGFRPEDVSFVDYCDQPLQTFIEEEVVATGSCEEDGFYQRLAVRWYAVDACGRRNEYQLLVDMIDSVAPEFSNVPQELFVECGDAVPAPLAIDACNELAVQILSEEKVWEGDCANEYDIERMLYAEDACGNGVSLKQIVHYIRTQGPEISGVEEQTCDPTMPVVKAVSACTGQEFPVSVTERVVPNTCGKGDIVIRTFTATDDCGNMTQKVQRIYRGDNEAPVLTWKHRRYPNVINGDVLTINCSDIADLDRAFEYGFRESDVVPANECTYDVAMKAEAVPNSSCLSTGYFSQMDYSWVVTDACGNSSRFAIRVNYVDDLAPVFVSAPADVTVYCNRAPAAETVIVDDNCGTVVDISFREEQLESPRPGVTRLRRSWTATDECGNASVHTQLVTVDMKYDFACTFDPFAIPGCDTRNNRIGVDVRGGTAPYRYIWRIEGADCLVESGQGTNRIQYKIGFSNVRIFVTVIDANGCVTDCEIEFACDPLAGVDPGEGTGSREGFVFGLEQVFPNPTGGELYLDYHANRDQMGTIRYLDALGREVRREPISLKEGKHTILQNVSRFESGVYQVEIISGEQVASQRFLRY